MRPLSNTTSANLNATDTGVAQIEMVNTHNLCVLVIDTEVQGSS